jgi:hypothetical protein
MNWISKGAVAVALAAIGFGVGIAVAQSGGPTEPAAPAAQVVTTERTTTTTRPTTTAPTTTTISDDPCAPFIGWEVNAGWIADNCDPDSPHAPWAQTTTTAPPPIEVPPPEVVDEPVCDLECTEQILCGYDGCDEPVSPATPTTSAPCRPSTIRGCDPDEPMELPVIGCEYLERDITGKVRCVD